MHFELHFVVPGKLKSVIPLTSGRHVIGHLLSNQIVLDKPGIDPIHAMIEVDRDGSLLLTDLGSEHGTRVNGQNVDVDVELGPSDIIEIGGVSLNLIEKALVAAPSRSKAKDQDAGEPKKKSPKNPSTQSQIENRQSEKTSELGEKRHESSSELSDSKPAEDEVKEKKKEKRFSSGMLFSPRFPNPSGDVLEVVSYWGPSIVEVEHYKEGFNRGSEVYVGDQADCHFIPGGDIPLVKHALAQVHHNGGFTLSLTSSMTARARRNGTFENLSGPGRYRFSQSDIAHVRNGAVRFFLSAKQLPRLDLPRLGLSDPFLIKLIVAALSLYILFCGLLLSYGGKKAKPEEKPWSVVSIAKPVPPRPKPKTRPKPKRKKEVSVAQKKKPPVVPKKISRQKPKPVSVKQPAKPTPKKVQVRLSTKSSHLKKKSVNSKGGTPKPKVSPKKVSSMPSGRVGNALSGSVRRGRSKMNLPGVKSAPSRKPSGVNLSNLGIGVGKISSKSGLGAISTTFRSSAGGAGRGMGSGTKTLGLGGLGTTRSMGISGASAAVSQFSSGAISKTSGLGGLRKGKRGGVSAGAPLISGSLSYQQIEAVIRSNQHQLRQCYEQHVRSSSPSARGTVKVYFVIAGNGRVSSVSITSSPFGSAAFGRCFRGKMRGWKFPSPVGGGNVNVNKAFNFFPG